jgi:hypothetical protein
MNEEPSFEECLDILEDSFLKLIRDFKGELLVDFQHPSVRDALFHILEGNSIARKRYITAASTSTLASLLARVGDCESNAPARGLSIRNEEELNLLCAQIGRAIGASIPSRDWKRIMSNAISLIPPAELGPISYAESHQEDYSFTPRGRLLSEVVRKGCDYQTYETKTGYGLNEWNSTLKLLYELTRYSYPQTKPAYIHQLGVRFLKSSINDLVPFFELLSKNEPHEFAGIFTEEVDHECYEKILDELRQYLESGQSLSNNASLSDWDDVDDRRKIQTVLAADLWASEIAEELRTWLDEAEDLMEVAEMYSHLSKYSLLKESNALRELITENYIVLYYRLPRWWNVPESTLSDSSDAQEVQSSSNEAEMIDSIFDDLCPHARVNVPISKIAFVKYELTDEEEKRMAELQNASSQSAADVGPIMAAPPAPSLREKLQGILNELRNFETGNKLIEEQRFLTEFPETETGKKLGMQAPELKRLLDVLVRDGIISSPRKDFLKRTYS